MRKKFVATLMAVFMVIGTAGCGNDTTPMYSSEPISATPETVDSEPETTKSSAEEMSSSAENTDEIGGTAEESTEANNQPEEVITPEENTEEDEAWKHTRWWNDSKISGLIIMTATAPLGDGTCEVISFDPESGETKVLSNFWFKNSSDVGYLWSDSAAGGYYQFDDAYTRMTTRKFLSAAGDEHAGWLTTDGEFFDVTEAIGEARKSDFDDPVHHYSMGFTDNGLFVFSGANGYYSVPVSDVSADTVQECRAISYSGFALESYDEYRDIFRFHGTPSSWIDSTHCVLTPIRSLGSPVTSVIFNTEDMTSTDYIPGDSRNNWNGQVSPDGSQIAFVSVPRSGNESPDIFIVPVSGGDPVRVAEHDFVLADVNPRFGASTYDSCTMLIDWR